MFTAMMYADGRIGAQRVNSREGSQMTVTSDTSVITILTVHNPDSKNGRKPAIQYRPGVLSQRSPVYVQPINLTVLLLGLGCRHREATITGIVVIEKI
jgi:hypothetical protein